MIYGSINPVTNAWTQKANFGGSGNDAGVGFSIGNKRIYWNRYRW